MLNEIEASSLIEQYFDTRWAARTPINWDNDNATPSGNHVAFTIDHDRSVFHNLGNEGGGQTYRREGLITVQVFTRQGTGTEDSRALAFQVQQILEGYRNASLLIKAGVVRKIGEDGNGFWQANVDLPFEYLEVREVV